MRTLRIATALLALGALACSGSSPSEPADPGDAGTDVAGVEAPEPPDGATLYGTYCAICHADTGQGYAADNANAVANESFLAVATDEFLAAAIRRGRPGTAMSAWGFEHGGPLEDSAVDTLVAYIRAWQTEASADVHDEVVEGVADRGALQRELRCAECHGAQGEGGTFQSVANPEFLATASDGFLRYAIEHGRPGTPMVPYGGVLTAQAIGDIVVLLRSWQTEAPDPPGGQLPPKVSNPILNPDGPEPALGDDPEFVPADTLHAALEAGARISLVDARPYSDYVVDHVSGAVSVPFYAAAELADQIPQGTWTVCYCACPHAESGQVAQVLRDAGHTKVRVLDEGYLVWKEKGYPITQGAAP